MNRDSALIDVLSRCSNCGTGEERQKGNLVVGEHYCGLVCKSFGKVENKKAEDVGEKGDGRVGIILVY